MDSARMWTDSLARERWKRNCRIFPLNMKLVKRIGNTRLQQNNLNRKQIEWQWELSVQYL